ncbi:MAG: hypothetical protein ABIS18_01140 [Actinomycetota bacterium]
MSLLVLVFFDRLHGLGVKPLGVVYVSVVYGRLVLFGRVDGS